MDIGTTQFIHGSFGGAYYQMYPGVVFSMPTDQFAPADMSQATVRAMPTALQPPNFGPGTTTIPPVQQTMDFDEWKNRLHPDVFPFLESMINDDKLMKRDELDHGCVEELVRSCEQSPEQTRRILATFKDALSRPNPYKGPINNPSAYLTKMLKNPFPVSRGRGRGRGEHGRGRGRRGPIEETDTAKYCNQLLENVMGPRFAELDHRAKNYLYKQSRQMIEYIADEWNHQNGDVKHPSNWVTKIITAKSKSQPAQPEPEPLQQAESEEPPQDDQQPEPEP